MSDERRAQLLRNALFVLRRSVAAASAVLVAEWIGLPHPVWAAISAIIVSQDHFGETRQVALIRLAGSCVGVVIAVAVGAQVAGLGGGPAVQIAVAVAVAAGVARRWPALRVCMWTCPIVILTVTPDVSICWAGVWRGAETVVGCLVGSGVHLLFEPVWHHLAVLQRRGLRALHRH